MTKDGAERPTETVVEQRRPGHCLSAKEERKKKTETFNKGDRLSWFVFDWSGKDCFVRLVMVVAVDRLQ